MQWAIKYDAPRSRLHSAAGRGMVINDYTSEIKRFPTREIAQSYATLSHMRGAKIEGIR